MPRTVRRSASVRQHRDTLDQFDSPPRYLSKPPPGTGHGPAKPRAQADCREPGFHRLLDLRARHPEERILIVSHGDVIKAVLMHFLGIPIDLCHRLTIAPTSISQIELHTDYVCIPRINDTSHIERPGCCSQSNSL